MTKFTGPFEDVEVREPDEHGVLRPVPPPSAMNELHRGYREGSNPGLAWRVFAVLAFIAFLFWRHW